MIDTSTPRHLNTLVPQGTTWPAMHLDSAVRELLTAFSEFAQAALGERLLALYVTGSLLMGDFVPASSDIDFLGVLRASPDEDMARRLAAAHSALSASSVWGDRLEGGYAARAGLRPWGIAGRIAAVEPGRGMIGLVESDYSADNMIALREHSQVLYGPPPTELLPAVDRETLTAGLRAYLAELIDRPAESEPSATVVASWLLNLARCLYGIAAGRPCTKSEAARWLAGRAPALAPALEAALAVRRGDAGDETLPALRAGFALLCRHAVG